MEKSLLPYQTLINEAVAYLNKIGYVHRSLDRFYQEWVKIGQYMAAHNIERYTPEVGSLYLNDSTGHLEYDSLNQSLTMKKILRIMIEEIDYYVETEWRYE